jgi:hypothetical protein
MPKIAFCRYPQKNMKLKQLFINGSIWIAIMAIVWHSAGPTLAPKYQNVLFRDTQNLSIILKSNSFCQIKEIRQASCPKGFIIAKIHNLPYKFNEDTLLYHIVAPEPITLYGKMLNSLQLSFQNMIARFLGKEVVLIQKNDKGQDNYIPVKLLGPNNNNWITFHNGILDFQSTGKIGFPVVPPDLFSSLTLYFYNPKEQNCSCSLYYFCPLLIWGAQYVAELDLDQQTIIFNANLKLHNFSGLDYKNASILWVPPWVRSKDIKNQLLARNITIPNGSKYLVPFSSVKQKAEIHYYLALDPLKGKGIQTAERRFVLSKLNLNKFPNGPMNVYLKRANDFVHLSSPLLKSLSDKQLEISVDKDPDIYAYTKQIQMRTLGQDRKEETYYLDFFNNTSKAVDIIVLLNASKKWDFVQASEAPQEKSDGFMWKIHIPPKEHFFFWYRTNLPLYNVEK